MNEEDEEVATDTEATRDVAEDTEDTPPLPSSSWLKRLVQPVASILVIGVSLAVLALMVATRPEAQRVETEDRGIPVRVVEASSTDETLAITAQGTVIPAQQMIMSPEVSGRIVWVSPNLVAGGRVRAGETLVRIDASDYQAMVDQQTAQVAGQELVLQQERGRQFAAEREWALLNEHTPTRPEGRELALRRPQIEAAEAALRAAQSGQRRAQNNVSRTTLTAPFDAVVHSENAEVGQLVGPAAQVATLIGTAQFWVQVSVPVESLPWIDIPTPPADHGSSANVWQEVGDHGRIAREGYVTRLLSDLDPMGRMARLIVAIDQPYGAGPIERGDPNTLPLFLNGLAHVQMDAGSLSDVFELPRETVHEERMVYIFQEDATLGVQTVDIVWRRRDTLLVRGLNNGDRIISSNLRVSIPGTRLRLADPLPEAAEVLSP